MNVDVYLRNAKFCLVRYNACLNLGLPESWARRFSTFNKTDAYTEADALEQFSHIDTILTSFDFWSVTPERALYWAEIERGVKDFDQNYLEFLSPKYDLIKPITPVYAILNQFCRYYPRSELNFGTIMDTFVNDGYLDVDQMQLTSVNWLLEDEDIFVWYSFRNDIQKQFGSMIRLE